ncbi:MAG TPA: hypothetical protein VJI32_04615 [Candidatus Nanoarchaeia archaeon]|nr:hypothetical protein [Candidatus Nanoarchaeia archaeon]
MNTKAQFDLARKTIGWMVLGFMTSIVVLYVAYSIASYQDKLTQIPGEVRAEFISLRFTNLPECFAVVDAHTTEVMAGTIDLDKFDLDTLNQCYKTEESQGFKTFNFRLQLVGVGKEIITNNYAHHDSFKLEKEVLVKQGNSFNKDLLIIHVQEKI